MTASSPPALNEAEIAAALRRALAALSAEGAYGFDENPGAGSRLVIVAPRHGVSVRAGLAAPQIVARLVAEGLAVWGSGGVNLRRRLALTQAGRARAARESAHPGADPFLAQHVPLARRPADASPDAREVLVDEAESPIAWLATRKGRDGKALVDAAMLQAGDRLRRDLTIAQILPRVTANWTAAVASGARGAGAETLGEVVVAARQRVSKALDAVGADFAGLLVDVCGFGKGLELIEIERGWPLRSAKVVLVLALNQLRRHYGIDNEARGPERSRGVRQWGAEDFRPSLLGAR